MRRCFGYQVEEDGAEIVIRCAVCGPSRVSRASAAAMLDPVLGILGPLGRFQTNARLPDREALARRLAEVLALPEPVSPADKFELDELAPVGDPIGKG